MSAMMISALKMIADRMALCGVAKLHDVEHAKLRIEREKHRRDDGEVLRHVIGDRERRQRAARHEQLFSDLHHLDELGRIGVEIDHVAGLARGLRSALHADADIGLSERGRIVGAVTAHGDQATLRLLAADVAQLVLRRRLGDEIIDAGFRGNRSGGHRVVAGDHHGLDAHAAQRVETLAHVRLHHVLQVNHPEDTVAVDKPKRRSA